MVPRHLAAYLGSDALLNARLKAAGIHGENLSFEDIGDKGLEDGENKSEAKFTCSEDQQRRANSLD